MTEMQSGQSGGGGGGGAGTAAARPKPNQSATAARLGLDPTLPVRYFRHVRIVTGSAPAPPQATLLALHPWPPCSSTQCSDAPNSPLTHALDALSHQSGQ